MGFLFTYGTLQGFGLLIMNSPLSGNVVIRYLDTLLHDRFLPSNGALVIIGLLVFLRLTLGTWGFFTGAVHLIIVVFFF